MFTSMRTSHSFTVMMTELSVHRFIALSLAIIATLSVLPIDAQQQNLSTPKPKPPASFSISLRSSPESTESGWFEWLFPGQAPTSDALELNFSGRHDEHLLEERRKGSWFDLWKPVMAEDASDKSMETKKDCVTSTGSQGICQPMKHCKISQPTEKVFAACASLDDLACCPKFNENLQTLEEKYKLKLQVIEQVTSSESSETTATSQGTITSERKCGIVPLKMNSKKRKNRKNKKKKKHGRIVNGFDAQDGESPWFVSILNRGNFICGGTIIAKRYVVTAAHCVNFSRDFPSRFSVAVGSILKNFGTKIRVESIEVHPDYKGTEIYHDIAILKLRKEIVYTDYVVPICLPAPVMVGENLVNRTVTVAGFGDLEFGGTPSPKLQLLDMKVHPNEVCNRSYNQLVDASSKFPHGIDKKLICAGYYEGGKDACQGDSGGPLSFENQEINYLVGIVSFGYECAKPEFPGVYTATAQYLDFIQKSIE